MTSAKKIEANRRNALRSTGPRTAAGKARSRQNATRHGLAAVLKEYTQVPAPAVAKLAAVIAAGFSDPLAEAHGIAFAEAEMRLRRARAAQEAVMAELETETPGPDAHAHFDRVATALQTVLRLHRYERRARSSRRRAIQELMGAPPPRARRPPRSGFRCRHPVPANLLQPAPLPPLRLKPAAAPRPPRTPRLSCPKRKKIDYSDPAVLARLREAAKTHGPDLSWYYLVRARKVEKAASLLHKYVRIKKQLAKAIAAQKKKSEAEPIADDSS
jgi:hypothetical protein